MAFTRKNIIEMICYNLNTQNYVLLDDFESDVARHICQGVPFINLLNKESMVLVFPDGSGTLEVEYFLCRKCGKLYLHKDNLTQVQMPDMSMNGFNGMENPNGGYNNFGGAFGRGTMGVW